MSNQSIVSINTDQLPVTQISLREKGRGSNKYLAWTNEDVNYPNKTVDLSEGQIHEYTAQALKEFENAANALRRAEDRVETLRMFARKLYAAPTLTAVGGE